MDFGSKLNSLLEDLANLDGKMLEGWLIFCLLVSGKGEKNNLWCCEFARNMPVRHKK